MITRRLFVKRTLAGATAVALAGLGSGPVWGGDHDGPKWQWFRQMTTVFVDAFETKFEHDEINPEGMTFNVYVDERMPRYGRVGWYGIAEVNGQEYGMSIDCKRNLLPFSDAELPKVARFLDQVVRQRFGIA